MSLSNRIALLQRAEEAAREGKYDEALGVISRCLDLYPTFSPARVLRAEIFSRTERPGDAVAELQGIIQTNPENIRARILLTSVFLDMENIKEAARHLEFLEFMMPAEDPTLQELRERMEQYKPNSDAGPEQCDLVENVATEDNTGPVSELPVSGGEATPGAREQRDSEAAEADTEVLDLGALDWKNQLEGVEGAVATDRSEAPTERIEDVAERIAHEAQSRQKLSEETLEVVGPVTAELVELDAELLSEPENDAESRQHQLDHADIPGESGTDAQQEVSIQTRTMALVYEKQGMYQEALDILKGLTGAEVSEDIDRIREKMKSGTGGRAQRKVARLVAWLEKIQCG